MVGIGARVGVLYAILIVDNSVWALIGLLSHPSTTAHLSGLAPYSSIAGTFPAWPELLLWGLYFAIMWIARPLSQILRDVDYNPSPSSDEKYNPSPSSDEKNPDDV
jgi:hypothetical protein